MVKLKQLLTKMVLVTGLVFGTTMVTAQVPTDNSLIQLAKLSDLEKGFQEGMKFGFISSFTQSLLNHPNIQQLPPEKQAKVGKIAENIGNKVLKDISTVDLSKKIVDDFVVITKKYYTQQEIDAMIEFYKTPVGQSIVAKQNLMMNDFTRQVMKTLGEDKEFNQVLEKSLEKHTPDFEKQLEALLK